MVSNIGRIRYASAISYRILRYPIQYGQYNFQRYGRYWWYWWADIDDIDTKKLLADTDTELNYGNDISRLNARIGSTHKSKNNEWIKHLVENMKQWKGMNWLTENNHDNWLMISLLWIRYEIGYRNLLQSSKGLHLTWLCNSSTFSHRKGELILIMSKHSLK